MQDKNYSSIRSVLLALFCTLVLYSGSANANSDDTPHSVTAEIAFVDFDSTDDTLNDGDIMLIVRGMRSYSAYSPTGLVDTTKHEPSHKRLNFNAVRGSPTPV
jgi:hypothetical protein